MENNQEQNNEEIKPPKKIDIRKYKDLSGASLSKLSFGLWIARNKWNFRRIVIIFLSIIASISWSYSLYHFAYYFAIGKNNDEKMVADMLADNLVGHDYFLSKAPKNLIYSAIDITQQTKEKYDISVTVQNPNQYYWAKFDYCFTELNREIECGNGFILPGGSKYLLSLGNDAGARKANIKFTITDVSWRRINRHDIYDWDKFYEEHTMIKISDINFTPGEVSLVSGELNLNVLKFHIKNDTPYNYRNLKLNILFFNRGQITAVSSYIIPKFLAREDKDIEITWVGNTAKPDNIEIQPDVNLLDDESYIKFRIDDL